MPGVFSFKRNFLFDLDGTLVDSAPAHARAFIETLTRGHRRLAESFDYTKFAGIPTHDVFLALGIPDEEESAELTRNKQELYRAALERGEVTVFEGAIDFLARLREQGRLVYLVTGASRLSAQHILETAKLDGYFSGIIAAEDVSRGKPAPEPYLHALAAYSLTAPDSIAVEDGENGVQAAQLAGIDVVTVHGEKVLPSLPHARNFDELAALFFT